METYALRNMSRSVTKFTLYSEVPNEYKLCGIPVDRACFAFGVVAAVIRGVYIAYYCVYGGEIPGERPTSQSMESAKCYFSYAAFLFSIILCIAVQKRLPELLFVYFVYGVVFNVVVVIASIIVITMTPDFIRPLVALFECAVYSIILLMVQRARKLFLAEQSINAKQPLDLEACKQTKPLEPEAWKETKALAPETFKDGKAYNSIQASAPMGPLH